jgi:hypothetical protein
MKKSAVTSPEFCELGPCLLLTSCGCLLRYHELGLN